ncbi:DUF2062 domain-containing protein [Acidihalobacter ferrooxydans]|uniref:DUF2062 domain-containing protein n=1 Tax=Acidihalobacter ferrooxydans TaxID=1765967 RepID=A0A1P8UF98_9GAMM|nr:hypothetical protein BW247_04885 [Acidihalobacter ferrooxydans]
MWHLNRRSISGGVAVGLFMAFVPLPFQMLFAAVAAIILRVNLPTAAALVWISNPLTMPPILFFAYKLGLWVLRRSPHHMPAFTLSLEWFGGEFLKIWEPLLVGSFLLSASTALLGYAGMRLFWRCTVARRWALRRQRRLSGEPR